MKKLFLLVFIVSVVGVATAEVIDSVSFNPSRLGRYEHLKVSDKLDVGCLTTQSMMLDIGCQVTVNYSGSSAVDIGCAHVSEVDMDDKTIMYVPSVYLIGGRTETNGDVTLKGDLQAPEATSVYARTLNLPNHTVSVNGGGKLWEGENSSDKSFVLGGNNISSPTECESLAWFTRTDEKTDADFKVLGCNPKHKEAKCLVLSDFGTASSPGPGTDTCDGNNYGWYSGACTEEMLAKGSCMDYYNIGCSTANMTGRWCYQTAAGSYQCQSPSDWDLPSYKKSSYMQGECGCPSYNCTTTNEEAQCANDSKCRTILNMARGSGSYNPTAICRALFPITDHLISSPTYFGLSHWKDNLYVYEREGAYCYGRGNSVNRCMCCGGYSNPEKFDCFPFKLRCELEATKDTTSLYRKYTFKTVYE